jgi:hypothetical protein
MEITGHMLELLAWVSDRPRTYEETIEAWVSNCPRLSTWDDAVGDGLVEVARGNGRDASLVALTAAGRAVLDEHRARAADVR